MPSIGVLGFAAGASEGFSKFLSEESKAARAARLEEVRAENQRETNRQSSEQRHELNTQENVQKHDLSLQEIKARETSQINAADETAPKYGDPTEVDGMPGQFNERTGQFDPFPARTSTSKYEKVDFVEEPVLDAEGNPVINMVTGEPMTEVTGANRIDRQGNFSSTKMDQERQQRESRIQQIMDYNEKQGNPVTREAVEAALAGRDKNTK